MSRRLDNPDPLFFERGLDAGLVLRCVLLNLLADCVNVLVETSEPLLHAIEPLPGHFGGTAGVHQLLLNRALAVAEESGEKLE